MPGILLPDASHVEGGECSGSEYVEEGYCVVLLEFAVIIIVFEPLS
jgi:hypothetical protein